MLCRKRSNGKRRPAAVIALCFAATILGCAKDEKPAAQVAPAVVDLASTRCAAVDPADRAEADRVTERPPFDTKDADGTAALSRAGIRKWINGYQVAEGRKNATIKRLASSIDECGRVRTGAQHPKTS